VRVNVFIKFCVRISVELIIRAIIRANTLTLTLREIERQKRGERYREKGLCWGLPLFSDPLDGPNRPIKDSNIIVCADSMGPRNRIKVKIQVRVKVRIKIKIKLRILAI
jgi:hypothetical protein